MVPPWMTAAKFQSLLIRVGRVRWNVRVQKRYPHAVSVAGYLARYMSGEFCNSESLLRGRLMPTSRESARLLLCPMPVVAVMANGSLRDSRECGTGWHRP